MTNDWHQPISVLKGVGPKTLVYFETLGIQTLKDLLFHFPFRYEDIQARSLNAILDGEKVTLKGTVVSPPVVNYFGRKKNRLSFRLSVDEHNVIGVSFFNQAYLAKSIELGQTKAILGKWQADRQTLMGMRLISQGQDGDSLSAVYSTTKGLKQTTIIKAIEQAFDWVKESIPEVLPNYLNDKYRLIPLADALYNIHFPKDETHYKQAQRKLIFQEFFLYQWRLALANAKGSNQLGVRVLYDNEALRDVIANLPYELTAAQKQAVNEICYDLIAPFPMRRMLQGDVGSGKTLVAFISMMATVLAGYQTVMMAPTEILAKQHQINFNKIIEPLGYQAVLLTSGMKASERENILTGLASGRIRIVIGTHALIQPTVIYKQLGLIIIDEQHRFGVEQRQQLMDKLEGEVRVNVLQMTATPIPRSLAQTLYGDMSVSTIDQMPKNRLPIVTMLMKEEDLEQLYERMRDQLHKGHQVYYVLPIIDQSEHFDQLENVTAVLEKLSVAFPDFQVGGLHGQMSKTHQQEVMDQFKANDIQILVATTMVEVGVDVGNATVIVIHGAERFGLAQLHQLRGRVGRSHLQSYCYLIGNPTTEQGKRRLAIMETESDGFVLSQEDMKIRGMGDLLGQAQSGVPEFHYANLIEDQHIHNVAKTEVKVLLADNLIVSEQEIARLTAWVQEDQMKI